MHQALCENFFFEKLLKKQSLKVVGVITVDKQVRPFFFLQKLFFNKLF